MTPETLRRRRKLIIIGACVLVVGLLALGLFNRSGVRVNVNALPSDSQITLDGQPIKAGTIRLAPGTHVFRATRADFGPTSQTVNTKNLQNGQTISLLPVPNTQAAIDYLLKHPSVQQQREGASSTQAAQTQQQIATAYPILAQLPYMTTDYLIDYSLDTANKLSLQITIYPLTSESSDADLYNQQIDTYKQEALKFLQSNGFDPTSVPITYTIDQSNSN